MNIYRQKYGIVKNELYAFGRKIGMNKSGIHKQEFWEDKFSSLRNDKTWEYVITAYLAFWCSEEERKFISSIFFERNTVKAVSLSTYLSEAACYAKKEKIMDCIIGMAIQCGLLTVDFINGNSIVEIACCIDDPIICDEKWTVIEQIIRNRDKRAVKYARKSIEAMVLIKQNNIHWRELPPYYGKWKSIYNRYIRWRKSGLWLCICQTLGLNG